MGLSVSVVIPTLNAAEPLARLLAQLHETADEGLSLEIVVSDGGSTDGTVAVAQATGAWLIEGARSRGGQLRRGAAAATGAWLLVLHADSVLPPGWARELASHAANCPDRAAVFRLRFDATGPGAALTGGWANLRSRLFGLPYGDQGLFLPRRAYDAAGGYADVPLMEDVDIIRRLPKRPCVLRGAITTSAARYLREGWLRRGARNLGTLGLYFAGVSPARLAERYNLRSGRQ